MPRRPVPTTVPAPTASRLRSRGDGGTRRSIGGTGKPPAVRSPRRPAGSTSGSVGLSDPAAAARAAIRVSRLAVREAMSSPASTISAIGTPTKTATSPLFRPASRETVRIVATTRIQTSAVGTSTFQPKRMNWS